MRLLKDSVKRVSSNDTVLASGTATIDTSTAVDTIAVVTGGTGTAKVEAYIGTTAVDVTAAGIISIPSNANQVVITETGTLNPITYSIEYFSGV